MTRQAVSVTTTTSDADRTLWDLADPEWAEAARRARHSAGNPDWHTPAPIVDAAREVLGTIDLDPCSCADANLVVQAERFFTVGDNGLMLPWAGRLFVNPPGKQTAAFWRKLIEEPIDAAIWIGFSLESLQTLQRSGAPKTPLDWPICIPSRRISFVESAAKADARRAKLRAQGKRESLADSPAHGNYITYIGPSADRFVEVFGRFGQCVEPR
jgi:hypothetical protein